MNWFEKLMTKLFPYVDIYRDGTTDIYLRRFFIYPRNKEFQPNEFKPRIYLHKFYRGDEDPHLHDHPWPYTSLILTRGYFEETPINEVMDFKEFISDEEYLSSEIVDGNGDQAFPSNWRRRILYKPWTLLRRPAVWKHRVILRDGKPAWTLIKTGKKERSWGFWTDDKSELDFCPWRQYDQGVCYCTPEEKDENRQAANVLAESS
jgi:hypothetical protein